MLVSALKRLFEPVAQLGARSIARKATMVIFNE
jgi:hypothetical protein